MRSILIQSSLLAAVVAASSSSSGSNGPTPYLQEIITGRCYARPVGERAEDCPSIIGDFLGAINGRRDADIQVDDFRRYLNDADFAAPRDRGLFWIGVETPVDPAAPTLVVQDSLVRPEDTAGGALLNGLQFCGDDQRRGCPGIDAKHGAQASFWSGVYQTFAESLSGRVVVALPSGYDNAMAALVLNSLPLLNPDEVTHVDIVVQEGGCDTSDFVANAVNALGKISVACQADPYLLSIWLCADEHSAQCDFFHDNLQVFEKYTTSTTASNTETGPGVAGDKELRSAALQPDDVSGGRNRRVKGGRHDDDDDDENDDEDDNKAKSDTDGSRKSTHDGSETTTTTTTTSGDGHKKKSDTTTADEKTDGADATTPVPDDHVKSPGNEEPALKPKKHKLGFTLAMIPIVAVAGLILVLLYRTFQSRQPQYRPIPSVSRNV